MGGILWMENGVGEIYGHKYTPLLKRGCNLDKMNLELRQIFLLLVTTQARILRLR